MRSRLRLRRSAAPLTLLATLIISVGLVLPGAPAQAATNFGAELPTNGTMKSQGDMLSGGFSGHSIRLVMQTDNNLVLYKNWGGQGGTQVVCGASYTTGYADTHAYMSFIAGTFSVYDNAGVVRWSTQGHESDAWGFSVRIGYDTSTHQAFAAVYSGDYKKSFRFWKC